MSKTTILTRRKKSSFCQVRGKEGDDFFPTPEKKKKKTFIGWLDREQGQKMW